MSCDVWWCPFRRTTCRFLHAEAAPFVRLDRGLTVAHCHGFDWFVGLSVSLFTLLLLLLLGNGERTWLSRLTQVWSRRLRRDE